MIKCKNCAFYEEKKCRRYPPKAGSEGYSDDYVGVSFYFPSVEESDWCGEFRQKWFSNKEPIVIYIKN